MIKWHFGHRKIKPPGRAFFIGFLLFVITFISIFPTNIVTPESNNQNTFFFLLFLSCRLVYSLIHYNTRCIFSVCVCFSVYFVGTYACVFFLSSFLLVSAPYFRSYTFVGPAFLVFLLLFCFCVAPNFVVTIANRLISNWCWFFFLLFAKVLLTGNKMW